MRILWASPLPPVRSGVADYAVELIPALSQLAEIRVVSPSGSGPEPGSTGVVARWFLPQPQLLKTKFSWFTWETTHTIGG